MSHEPEYINQGTYVGLKKDTRAQSFLRATRRNIGYVNMKKEKKTNGPRALFSCNKNIIQYPKVRMWTSCLLSNISILDAQKNPEMLVVLYSHKLLTKKKNKREKE